MLQENIVVLDEVKLTSNLTIQKIALLNSTPMDGDQLPTKNGDPDYGIYVRIISFHGDISSSLIDYSGDVFGKSNLEDIFIFLSRNKKAPYPETKV